MNSQFSESTSDVSFLQNRLKEADQRLDRLSWEFTTAAVSCPSLLNCPHVHSAVLHVVKEVVSCSLVLMT